MLEYIEGGENEETVYRRIELTQYLILVSQTWALWATHIWRETKQAPLLTEAKFWHIILSEEGLR